MIDINDKDAFDVNFNENDEGCSSVITKESDKSEMPDDLEVITDNDNLEEIDCSVEDQEPADMRELYDTLSDGDNEPVYLSDGMWLTSDGSLVER